MSLVVAAAWIPAAVVAFVPLFNSEYVYSVAVSYKQLFGKHEMEKRELISLINRAGHLRTNTTEPFLLDNSWHSIENSLCDMYPTICDGQSKNPFIQQRFGYYSANSVCMPR